MSALSGLYPSFLGSSTVLNDGKSPNILTVALTNSNMFEGTSEQVDIEINSALDLAFYFIADPDMGTGHKPNDSEHFVLNWALAHTERVKAIQPHIYLPGEEIDYKNLKPHTPGWTTTADHPNITIGKLSTLHGWIFTPEKPFILKPGESILLVFSNIISDLPNGPSLAYMALEKEHYIKCGPLQKTPNYVSGNKVGIGTNTPLYPLTIADKALGPKISLWDGGDKKHFFGFGIDSGTLTYHADESGTHAFRAWNNKPGAEDQELMYIWDEGIDKGTVGITGKLGVGLPERERFNLKIAIGDASTGINQPAEGDISLVTNGENRLHIHKEGHIGLLGSQIVYQVDDESEDHIFISKISQSKTKELLRLKGNGNIGIGNADPKFPLHFAKDNGPKICLWGDSTNNSFLGFGVSPNQMNYRVPDGTSHVFYEGKSRNEVSTEDKEIMRISATSINIQSNLQGDNQPLVVSKSITAINDPDHGHYTDTGIDYNKYPVASIAGSSTSSYDVDEASARSWGMKMGKKSGSTNWQIWLEMPASGNSKGTWTIEVIAFHKYITKVL